jgi:hypothetical protein
VWGRLTVGVVAVLSSVAGVVAACGSDTAVGPGAAGPSSTAAPGSTAAPRPDAGAGTPAAEAAAPYCGSSRYVQEIIVARWADGEFRISLWPTPEARHAKDRDAAAAGLWQAVLGCVGSLRGPVAESLQDQLRCHEYLALVPAAGGAGGEERYATGETFDVESWRPTPGPTKWISTRCGNTLGANPASPPVQAYRPDGVQPEHTIAGEQA